MPWNGSGVFTRDYNWVNDRDGGIDITASRMDAEFDNIATGIQACIAKNGENAPTANLPMATFRHSNVGASSARNHYARVAEMVDGAHVAKDAGGSANAQTISVSPAITAYAKYQRFRFIPVADNTGACTINVSGQGAVSIKLVDGSDPVAGDLSTSGVADVIYNGSVFILTNPATVNGAWTSKTLTDPVIDGDVSGDGFLDEDDMSSDSPTKLASQQSIKAYVDGNVVLLDEPVQIASSATDVAAWGTVTASAVPAGTTRIKCKAVMILNRISLVSGAGIENNHMYVKSKASSSSADSTTNIVSVSANTQYYSAGHSSLDQDHSFFEVNIDGSKEFDWSVDWDTSVSSYLSNADSAVIYLIGYYVN